MTIKGCKGVLGAQARTVAAWIRTATNEYADLISWGVNEPGARWLMLLTRGSRKEAYGALQVAVGTGFAAGSTRVTDGQWHHVAAVLEGASNASFAIGGPQAVDNPSVGDVRLYVDGKPDAISASSDSPVNTVAGPDITFGTRLTGEPYLFDGSMDDVRIYRRALTAAEIEELVNAGFE